MATRFSASEARKKVELAKISSQEQRKLKNEAKNSLAKEKAFIKNGFNIQRLKLISAALNRDIVLSNLPQVFNYKSLLKLGFSVVEVGTINENSKNMDKLLKSDYLSVIKDDIISLIDYFIDQSNEDFSDHLKSVILYHKRNIDQLYLNLMYPKDAHKLQFLFSHNDDLPSDLLFEYSEQIQDISDKIDEYRMFVFHAENNLKIDLLNGEYSFRYYDEEIGVLEESYENNYFEIRWDLDCTSTHFNDSLFSANGLSWLVSSSGQNLINSIFHTLSFSAEQGHTKTKLSFALSEDGWYFVNNFVKTPSCSPDDLVEIINMEDFVINDTSSSAKSYSILVSW